MQEMTGGEGVVAALKAIGVTHVFGIVSVHNIPIYDAIYRDGTITAIGVRHEQGAVHAADGYARATGKLGVAIVSTGPGTVNAMPGLFEAQFASSRVLLLTGQVDTVYYGKGKGFLHEAPKQMDSLRSVTRLAESVRRAEDIGETVVRVARDIMTGRPQPGAIEIPVDLQYAKASIDIPHVEGWPRPQPPREAVAAAADALSKAKRPLIWAGGGVITADAAAELQQLAEYLGAPVVTSVNGRGAIPEDHPLALGPLSNDPAIDPIIQEADVVFAVGTRFQGGATRNWTLSIPGKLIHLDADPSVIGRNYAPGITVLSDAKPGLAAILKALSGKAAEPEYTARARAASDTARAAIREQIGPDYEAIMDAMRELLPRDGCIVRDATVPAYLWGNRLAPILEPRTSMMSTSAAIGPGLPLAIGAAIGSGKKTALIQGDGGFMLNLSELATAAQYKAPVIVCVFNDAGYGVLRSIEGRTFEGRQFGVELGSPDFAAIAKAMGMHGEAVKGVDQFRDAFARAVAAPGPVLLDIDMSVLQPMGGLGTPPPVAKK
ncbi:MAG: thiamine pyrophosphate-binding protein [Dehalococcoidia bacterium]